MNIKNIALLTTVANFDLYQKTAPFFPDNIQKLVIDGTNGMHGIHSILYMMRKLKGKNIEWLVMADEDVLFTDSKMVFSIIEKMKNEHYTICGVRDGGQIAHRNFNPYCINTFFSIINFKEIEQIWNTNEALSNQYVQFDEFDDDLNHLKGNYDKKSLYEPYYCFYFWLKRKNKKTLFLNTEMQVDGITNTVFFNDNVFLYHTWQARNYGKIQNHTKRIDAVLQNVGANIKSYQTPIVYKDNTFAFKQKIKKYIRKIAIKLRWEN
jgi:hypothetical protein